MGRTTRTIEVFRDGELVAIIETTWQAACRYDVTPATICRACRGSGTIGKHQGLTFRYGSLKKINPHGIQSIN